MDKIVIGLATYGRPKMLADCLLSLNKMVIEQNAQVELLVVDNNLVSKEVPALVKKLKNTKASLKMTCIHEDKRGIANARNAVLDYAAKAKANYIAFLDDDEIVDKTWIKELHQIITENKVDVVQAPVEQFYPEGTSAWFFPKPFKERPDLQNITVVSSNNVIFSAKLIGEMKLRFDDTLALAGGEDVDFFERAINLGAKAIRTNKAKIKEHIPHAKTILAIQLKRQFSCGAANSYRLRRLYGFSKAILKSAPKSISRILSGLLLLIIGGLGLRRRWITKALCSISSGCGTITGLFGKNIELYKTVVGS